MEKIGSGLYGSVYADAAIPDCVLKTGCGTDAWWAFARWISAVRPTLKPEIAAHFPDVRAVFMLPNGDSGAIMLRYVETVTQRRKAQRDTGETRIQEECAYYLRHLYNYDNFGTRAPRNIPHTLALAIKLLAMWARVYAPDAGVDLHGGNMMLARNGELVITDPFAATPGTTSSEERRRRAYLAALRACKHVKKEPMA